LSLRDTSSRKIPTLNIYEERLSPRFQRLLAALPACLCGHADRQEPAGLEKPGSF